MKQTIRVTLDLKPRAYQRLASVEALVGAESKADVLRQALQLYEFVAKRAAAGDRFKTVRPDGSEEMLVFLALPEHAME